MDTQNTSNKQKKQKTMKALKIIASIILGIGIGLIIRIGSKTQEPATVKTIAPLREGTFYPVHPDWQRLYIVIKKSSTNGVYEVTSSGSNGAVEPFDEEVFVVRQFPGQENLEVIAAYEYECVPKEGSDTIKRTGGEMAEVRRKLMTLIIKDDLLLVNGLAYRME